VCGGDTCGRGAGEWSRLRWGYMVNGLVCIWNRLKTPLAMALSGEGRGSMGRVGGDDPINVQFKPI
jgi:hypothetical protein